MVSKNMKKVLTIAGVKLTPEAYPNLYRIAETNPDGLAKQLRASRDVGNTEDLQSTAARVENDLAHD